MKRSHIKTCLLSLALLLILAVPVSAVSISDISPDVGTAGSSVKVTITGTNFSSTDGYVWLEMSGKNDIESTITSWTEEKIVARFAIPSATKTGAWDLVVKAYDSPQFVQKKAFTITYPMALTSISPKTGQVDDDEVDFTILGTGLSDVTDVYLYNTDYDKIEATDVVVMSSTKVEGTFDLTDAAKDTYDVCVVDSLDAEECDLSFRIAKTAYGSIDFSSSPSGASIYVDGTYEGTTPDTVDDLEEGSYKVVLRKSGYDDWGKVVKVIVGDTTEVDAVLTALTAAPTATAVRTTTPATVRTTVRSTLQVPTTWASSSTPAQESPADAAIIVGTVCLACLAFRKH